MYKFMKSFNSDYDFFVLRDDVVIWIKEPRLVSHEIKSKPKNLIFSYLNVNYVWKKFDMLSSN